jgi:hypothetical protein
MTSGRRPSRALLIAAGLLTQLGGAACFVLVLASLPVVHDLPTGLTGAVASAVAAIAAMVCGLLVYRGRLIPLALAAGVDIGFGISLPRGGSATAAVLQILPEDELAAADTLITVAAIGMFVAAILCVLAIPSALALRRWRRAELAAGESNLAITERWPRPPETLRGFGPPRMIPTAVVQPLPPAGVPAPGAMPRSKPAVVIGVAVTLIALGILVISAATGPSGDAGADAAGAGSARSVSSGDPDVGTPAAAAPPADEPAREHAMVDAGIDALEPVLPVLDEMLARFHEALRQPAGPELGLVFDSGAFGLGVQAHDVAEGRDAIVAMLRETLGKPPARGFEVAVRFTHAGQDGDAAWFAEELRVAGKTYLVTGVASVRDGAWVIVALHWALPMPNAQAFRLARDGELAIPDAIPNTHDDSPLAAAMRSAFASRPSFVEARSTRDSAFNFGSAPGERIKGGTAIRRVFGKLRASFALRDAVHVGRAGERGGWGVANVNFTDTDRDGTEVTQTFRVLAAWVQEDAGWRIVLTQFSNAR